jgi:hypothetical protein
MDTLQPAHNLKRKAALDDTVAPSKRQASNPRPTSLNDTIALSWEVDSARNISIPQYTLPLTTTHPGDTPQNNTAMGFGAPETYTSTPHHILPLTTPIAGSGAATDPSLSDSTLTSLSSSSQSTSFNTHHSAATSSNPMQTPSGPGSPSSDASSGSVINAGNRPRASSSLRNMTMSSDYGGMSTPSKARPRPDPRLVSPEVEIVKQKAKGKRGAQNAGDRDIDSGAPPKKRQAKGKGKEKDTSGPGGQGMNTGAGVKKAGSAPKATAKQDKGKGKEQKSKDDISETPEAKQNQEMLMQRVLQQQKAQHKDTLLQQVMKQKREANQMAKASKAGASSPAPFGQGQGSPLEMNGDGYAYPYGVGNAGSGMDFANSLTPGSNGTHSRPSSRSGTPIISSSPTPSPRIPKPLPREWAILATSSSQHQLQQQFYPMNQMNPQPQYQHQLPPKPHTPYINLSTPQPKSKLTYYQQAAFYNECVKRGINPTEVPVERLTMAMERFRVRVEEESAKGLRDVGQGEKEFLSPESVRILRGESKGQGMGMGLGIQGLEGDLRMRMGMGIGDMGVQGPGTSQGFPNQMSPMGQSRLQGRSMIIGAQGQGMPEQYNQTSPPPRVGSQGLEGYPVHSNQMSPWPRTGSQGLEGYQLQPNQTSPSLHMRDQTPGLGQMSPPGIGSQTPGVGQMSPPPIRSQSPGMEQTHPPGPVPFNVLLRSPSMQNVRLSSPNIGVQNYGNSQQIGGQMSPPGMGMGGHGHGHGHGEVQQNRRQISSLNDTMGMDFDSQGHSGIQHYGSQMSPPSMNARMGGKSQGRVQQQYPPTSPSNADQGRIQSMIPLSNTANMRSFPNRDSALAEKPVSKMAPPKQQRAQEPSEVQGQMAQPNPGAPKIVLKMPSKSTTQVNLKETTNASQSEGNARKVQKPKRTAKLKPDTPLLTDDQQMKRMLLSQLAETSAEQAAARDAYPGSDDEHEKRRRVLEKNVRAASGYRPRVKPGSAKDGGAEVESAQPTRRNPPRVNSRQRNIQPEEDLEYLEEEEPAAVVMPKTKPMQQTAQSPVEQLINKFQPLGSPQLHQKGGLSPIDKLMITKFGPQNQRQAQLHQKNLAQTPFQKLVSSALEDRAGPIRHRGKGKIRGSKFNEKYNELVSDVPQPPPFSPITPAGKNYNQKQPRSTHGPPPQQKLQEKQLRPRQPLPFTQDKQHQPHPLYQAYQQQYPQLQQQLAPPPPPPVRELTLAERFPPTRNRRPIPPRSANHRLSQNRRPHAMVSTLRIKP